MAADVAGHETVVQRVHRAAVRVDDELIAEIGTGLLLLVGVERGDTIADAEATARKIATLRVFPGRTPFDADVSDAEGACLVVSQFTLAGSVQKGRRPSFDAAEDPTAAKSLYLCVASALRDAGLPVETGRFGATMNVELTNDGPVTLLVFTRDGVVL